MQKPARGLSILAILIGVAVGSAAPMLNVQPLKAEEEAPKSHRHLEPDGSWFCHCGFNNECRPCA